ncbi:MarR family transcriptional regulator [Streptomyces sp. NPDC050804]|uniref:MarR family winged helix-turn-helix transcriptional regulator n=1 Tax=unclassified Streptomyces TaxID=2593676 RepID=UPI0034256B21|nr:MarR family transcriptional regulator [Streptomyces sp. NBC_00872]
MRPSPKSALEAVYEIVMATTHRAEPELSALGLTMSTAYALWAMDPEEPAPTMKVMAQRLRCNASSLTFISDRLVKLGYITRTEDPANRRFRVLALTGTGRAARDKALTALEESCPLIRLTRVEQDDVLHLLARTLIDPDRAPDGGSDGGSDRTDGEGAGTAGVPRRGTGEAVASTPARRRPRTRASATNDG